MSQPDTSLALHAAERGVCAYLRLGRPNVEECMLVLAEH